MFDRRTLQAIAGGVQLVDGEMPVVGSGGQAAFWICSALCLACAAYAYRSTNFASHSAESRGVYRMALFAFATLCISSFICGLGTLPSKPFTPDFDFTWFTYATWVFKTPFLLVLMAHMGGIGTAGQFALVLLTEIMVGFGWCAQTQSSHKQIWPLFALGFIPQLAIFAQVRLRAEPRPRL